MPAPGAGNAAVKRKRQSDAEPPTKRARSESSDDDDDESDASDGDGDGRAEDILLLESEILESKKNYNNIVALLEIAQTKGGDDGAALFAAVSLCRVFVRLLSSGSLTKRKGISEKDLVVVTWLRERMSEYKKALRPLLSREESSSAALTLSMRLLKAEGQHLTGSGDYYFPRQWLSSVVGAMVHQGSSEALRAEFVEKYVDEYEDIKFYTFASVKEYVDAAMAGDLSPPEGFFEPVFDLLTSIEDPPGSNDELDEYYLDPPTKKGQPLRSASQQKKQAQEAWRALLNIGLTKDQRKKVLDIMSTVIAPWFVQPELLMDFITDSYNAGGAISLLALSGIFYLIQERNLDYPSFYTKLYSLLDADILHSKHRSRFLRLLDTFLASSHLPANLVASFIKRLARLALNAPPSAIVAIVPWYYNLLGRHPLCTFMLHRVPRTAEEKALVEGEGLADPFLPDEEDPMATRAIDSCLWEIVQLQSHYHPNVATIAKIISEQFTKQFYNTEDFLDHSYGSLLEAEISKNVKKAPVVEFQIPKRVLLPQDPDSGAKDSLIVRLWNFS